MSEHASPEGSNMQLDEGSANEIENAELQHNNNWLPGIIIKFQSITLINKKNYWKI